MGHIINPISLRLGLNRTWPLKTSGFAINLHLERFILEYVESFFDSRLLRDWGFIYSHVLLDQVSNNLFVKIYLYDGISETILSKLFDIFYKRESYKMSRKKLLRRKLRFAKRISNFPELRNFSYSEIFKLLVSQKYNYYGYISGFNYLNRSVYLRNLVDSVIRSKFYFLLEELLSLDFKSIFGLLSSSNLYVNIKPLYSSYLTAFSLGRYITRKLEYNYTLSEIMSPLMKGLEGTLLGFFVRCSGRFTRAQRSQRKDFRLGLSPQSTLSLSFDYAFRFSQLKYGVCGVKVWIVR
jgi:hypothetical protein